MAMAMLLWFFKNRFGGLKYKNGSHLALTMIHNGTSYPIGSMYAKYGNIYHQYTQMLAYIPYMDPMGMKVDDSGVTHILGHLHTIYHVDDSQNTSVLRPWPQIPSFPLCRVVLLVQTHGSTRKPTADPIKTNLPSGKLT